MMAEIIPSLLLVIGGATGSALITELFRRRQNRATADRTEAETADVLVGTSKEVVTQVREQLAENRRQIAALQMRVTHLEAVLRAQGIEPPHTPPNYVPLHIINGE